METRNHRRYARHLSVCILDVEREDRTWHWTQPRSRYHCASRGNSQMLKVMKDYVIPHTYVDAFLCIYHCLEVLKDRAKAA